jgi:Fe-S cluster assembly protein SufD
MEKSSFTNLFALFDRDAVLVYHPMRQAARQRFASLPWPTTRNEDWRFTNVTPLVETLFELPPTNVAVKIPPATNALRLVFVNGRWAKSYSSSLPQGLQIGSLATAKAGDIPLVQRIATDKDSVFTALNTSFINDGAYLGVPDGTIVEQPIEIVYLSQPADKPSISHPRILLFMGKTAQATVVERYIGDGAYFTNAVTEIALAEHAILDHVKLQQESTTAYHVANTQIVQSAHSTFTTHYLALGGALVRNEVRVRFDGEHSEATVNGLYLASGNQHIDNFTVIDHAKPNCASHELYKGILDGRAHGVFNGKIFVRKDAQKTDAKQTNKVLLLSDDATINTKPQLEIFADDVKCTHGATIGQLDAAQLFYLQSRGIPLDAARRLLTFAFANDIVGRLKLEALREELEARIVR